jgi:tripartite-type tricarboxylate transporter receptor subunit TctC
MSEYLPAFEASGWQGIGAPKNTSAEIINSLNRQINASLADSGVRARLSDLGSSVLPGSPSEFGQLIAAEIGKWGEVIVAAGIKAE